MLPLSGPLSFVELETEFGGAHPIALNEYYAGGAYLSKAAAGQLGAVPASGQISLANFRGVAGSLLGGARWVARPQTYALTDTEVFNSGSTLFTFGTSYVHRSTDGGFTWARLAKDSSMGVRVYGAKDGVLLGAKYVSVGSSTAPMSPGYTTYTMVESVDGVAWTDKANNTPISGTYYWQTVKSGTTTEETISVGRMRTGKLYGMSIHWLLSTRRWEKYSGTTLTGSGTEYISWRCLDGVNWQRSSTSSFNFDGNQPHTGTFIEGVGIDVGIGNDGIFYSHSAYGIPSYSKDLITWAPVQLFDSIGNSLAPTTRPTDFVKIAGKVVFMNTGRQVFVSTDGITFTQTATLMSNAVKFLASGPDYLLCVMDGGSNTTKLAISTDGETFTAISAYELAAVNVASMTYVAPNWVAIVQSSGIPYIAPA